MFGKLGALWTLFRQGEQISDAAKWKNRQITATALAGVILAACALAKQFGYSVPLDMDSATAIGGGIVAVVNIVLTIVTTDKVGLRAKGEVTDSKEPDYGDPGEPRNDR